MRYPLLITLGLGLCVCFQVSSIISEEVGVASFSNKKNELSTQAINALNQRCYDARADYWDRFPFADFLPPAIQRTFPSPKGKKALDIGSGTGKLALWLKNQGFDVICLDPSNEMVKRIGIFCLLF